MTGLHARRGAVSGSVLFDPDPAAVTLSHLDASATANLAALHAAAALHDTITIDVTSGTVAPISSTFDLPAGVTVDFGGNTLEVLGQGVNAIRCRGVGNQAYAVTGTLLAGDSTFSCALGGFAVDDWVMVMSRDDIKSTGDKSERGNFRQITAVDGTTYTVDKPWGRTMSTSILAARVDLAAGPTLTNGAVKMRYPEHSQFRGVVSFEGVMAPVLDNFEIHQGGSAGLELMNTVDALITGGSRIHDLLDDEDGTGWWREASTPGDPVIANPRTDAYKQHYGYGILLNGGNRGGLIDDSCTIDYVRHAVTTGAPWTFNKMHSSWHLLSGDPEDFVCEATIENTWSTCVSLHEQGDGIIFSNATWKNPGRLQNRFSSTNTQEDPNFYAARGKGVILRNLTWTFDVGYPQNKSSGFTGFTSTLEADLPRDNTLIENVLQLGGKYGIDTYQDVTVDRFKVVDPVTGGVILRSGLQSFVANDIYISLVGNPFTLHPTNNGVAFVDPIQFVSTTGTKIVNGTSTVGNVFVEGTVTQATGHT